MLQEFKCLKCKHYKNMHYMHWCTKCNDEIIFKSNGFRIDGFLFIPKLCYVNNLFEYSNDYIESIKQAKEIPDSGLCCQVED